VFILRGDGVDMSDMESPRLGHGRGVVAVLINIAVLIALLVVLGLLFGETHTRHGSASVHLTGVSALIWLVLALAYLIVPRLRTGQTIGRRLVGGRPSR
jgi:uncharacterized RDD family membrane protein YckC